MRYYTDTDVLAVDYCSSERLRIPRAADPVPRGIDPALIAQRQPARARSRSCFWATFARRRDSCCCRAWCDHCSTSYVKTGRLRFVVQAENSSRPGFSALCRKLWRSSKISHRARRAHRAARFSGPERILRRAREFRHRALPLSGRRLSGSQLGRTGRGDRRRQADCGAGRDRGSLGSKNPGSGETFTDLASLAAAVRSICEQYQEYAARRGVAQGHWRQNHSPARLVDCLLGTARDKRFRRSLNFRGKETLSDASAFSLSLGRLLTLPHSVRGICRVQSTRLSSIPGVRRSLRALSGSGPLTGRSLNGWLRERFPCIRSIRVLEVPARKL